MSLRRLLLGGSVVLAPSAYIYYRYRSQSSIRSEPQEAASKVPPPAPKMGSLAAATPNGALSIPPFQTTFALPLHCESCVRDVSAALDALPGVQSVAPSLEKQTVAVTSTCPPSALLSAIQSTGRDAILRGSGASNSAAVAILETQDPDRPTEESPVRGLVRIVQVSDSHTLLDCSVKGVKSGTWVASIRKTGDLSRGAASVGAVWDEPVESAISPVQKKGEIGVVEIGENGEGGVFVAKEVQVWEMIGRGLVLERMGEEKDSVMGVIARSAGVWDNEKTVCSCSGKTVWEEREEQKRRGML